MYQKLTKGISQQIDSNQNTLRNVTSKKIKIFLIYKYQKTELECLMRQEESEQQYYSVIV